MSNYHEKVLLDSFRKLEQEEKELILDFLQVRAEKAAIERRSAFKLIVNNPSARSIHG
jgi:hypothetical protein